MCEDYLVSSIVFFYFCVQYVGGWGGGGQMVKEPPPQLSSLQVSLLSLQSFGVGLGRH